MMGVKAAAIGLLVCVLTLLLREAGFRGARLVSLIGTVGLMGLAIVGVDRILDALSLAERLGDNAGQISDIFKIVGVGTVFGMISDMARDMGEMGVATALNVLGRVEIFALSVPYVNSVLELAIGYFGV